MRQIRIETTSNSSRSSGADETRKISGVVVGQIRLESTSSGADKWSSSGADLTRKMSRLNRKSSNRKSSITSNDKAHACISSTDHRTIAAILCKSCH